MDLKKSGFSLVEVMVVVAIFGIVGTGIASLLSDMAQGRNATRFSSEVITLEEEIRAHLSSKQACFNSLSSFVLAEGSEHSLNTIQDAGIPAPGAPKYDLTQIYGSGMVRIASMRLKYRNDPPGADPRSIGIGQLRIEFQSVIKVTGPQLKFREILLKITKNSTTNALIECIPLGKTSDGIWRYNPNDLTQVFYSGGSVGIGVTNPGNQLQIGKSDTILAVWSDPGDGYAAIEVHNVANSVKRPLVLNAWGGNVGIGTPTPITRLDVIGEMKVGNTGLACTASTEGAIRYFAQELQVCAPGSTAGTWQWKSGMGLQTGAHCGIQTISCTSSTPSYLSPSIPCGSTPITGTCSYDLSWGYIISSVQCPLGYVPSPVPAFTGTYTVYCVKN